MRGGIQLRSTEHVPRRVLEVLRLVLVEPMAEVLGEALVLAEPEGFLGNVPSSMEHRDGQLHVPDLQPAVLCHRPLRRGIRPG